jgi:hypothetical protein
VRLLALEIMIPGSLHLSDLTITFGYHPEVFTGSDKTRYLIHKRQSFPALLLILAPSVLIVVAEHSWGQKSVGTAKNQLTLIDL